MQRLETVWDWGLGESSTFMGPEEQDRGRGDDQMPSSRSSFGSPDHVVLGAKGHLVGFLPGDVGRTDVSSVAKEAN